MDIAQQKNRPIDNCYWVEHGRLLAGEYPAHFKPAKAKKRLEKFLGAGIRTFINLTEAEELPGYHDKLVDLAEQRGLEVTHTRLPIVDRHVPDDTTHMLKILKHIDQAIRGEKPVYVHCWGGIGRTGTVIGCYLVRNGLSGEESLDHLARLWPFMKKSRYFPHTPQTLTQFEYIANWPE